MKKTVLFSFLIITIGSLIMSGCVQLPSSQESSESAPPNEQAQTQTSQPTQAEDEAAQELEKVPGQNKTDTSQTEAPKADIDQQIKVKYEPKPDTIKVMTDALATGKPILIDFWAAWCGPCKELKPIIKDLESTYSSKMLFLEIDVDDAEGTKLADEFKVQYIPDIVVMNNDHEIVAHFTGFADKASLEAAVKKAVGM